MSENTHEELEDNISATEIPAHDEKDRRIIELEHMVMLQANTISAFQNRTYSLEMQIVELMSQIEYNNSTHQHLPEPVGPHPIPEP